MGQQQSSEKSPNSRSGTPQHEKDRKVNKRTSLQALPHPRAQLADPSASNASATAQNTTSHNVEKASLQHILQTSPEPVNKSSRVERSTSRKARKDMEYRPTPMSQPTASVAESLGVSESPAEANVVPAATPSTYINIPQSIPAPRGRSDATDPDADYRAYQERHYAPISHLRPPRLPIPIADARVPDSPTLMPVDVSNADVPIFDTDEPPSTTAESVMRRRSSFQSEATQDEEEVGDELQPYAVDPPAHTVPTVIEWKQPGERVFVTGTFATWDRKYRLHRRKSRDGLYCIINLPPGTHHLKFWVDSQMVTSNDLPTAVDFNNVLVNYIEISADDIPRGRRGSGQSGAQPVLGTANQQPSPDEPEEPEAITPGEELEEVEGHRYKEMPAGDFRQIIPQYLVDIDYAEDDSKYQQAAQVIQDGNGPPSLPMFLNRSILNGLLPVKDDSSVLTLPNHTVLNHMMTSSVKNGVLATSVTTRYKKKYVTTISFKPVPKLERKQ